MEGGCRCVIYIIEIGDMLEKGELSFGIPLSGRKLQAFISEVIHFKDSKSKRNQRQRQR